jgi:outer membrane protein assembly factor BamA
MCLLGPSLGRLASLGLFVLLVSALACSSTTRTLRETQGPAPVVEDVELVGVKRFSKEQMLEALHVDETSAMPLSRDYLVTPGLVAVDRRRVEELYRAHGYYQARVRAFDVFPDDDGEEARVRIAVEEGLPARVTSLGFVWTPDAPLGPAERRAIEARASLRKGGPFETVLFDASIGEMRIALLQSGFPLAKVTGSADVHEGARQADVELRVAPGPHATVGAVRFEGLSGVPRELLDVEVAFALDKPYSPAISTQIEEALKALRVFRWVAVVPPSEVRAGRVELVVRLSEADPHVVSVGPAISVETVRWQEQARLKYAYTNLFGNLTRLDVDLSAGYAELPNPWDPKTHGVVGKIEVGLRKKGILEPFLVWTLKPSASIDVQEGYRNWTAGYRAGVARWFGGDLSLGLSHNLNRVDFFDLSPVFDAGGTALGLDFRDPYLLSYAELQGTYYLVDVIRKPTNGVVLEATYDMAGTVFGGDYDYHKLVLALRGYYKPLTKLQIVSRLQAGAILPYGASPGAPINYRFYLGGPTLVRGFGSKRLSPKIEDCPEDGGDCSLVPVGGYSMVQGTLELRVPLVWRFSGVAFAELGDVLAGELDYDPSGWSYTGGPGLRVDTPLGLVRLDAGFRLNRQSAYQAEPGYSIYFGLGEAL